MNDIHSKAEKMRKDLEKLSREWDGEEALFGAMMDSGASFENAARESLRGQKGDPSAFTKHLAGFTLSDSERQRQIELFAEFKKETNRLKPGSPQMRLARQAWRKKGLLL